MNGIGSLQLLVNTYLHDSQTAVFTSTCKTKLPVKTKQKRKCTVIVWCYDIWKPQGKEQAV